MKNKIYALFVAMAVLGLLLPINALAQETTTTIAGRSADVCVAGPDAHARIDKKIDDARVKLENKRADLRDKKLGYKANVDSMIDKWSEKWDTRKADTIGKLREKATTDAQIAAVETFADKVDAARDERDIAVKAAREKFHSDMDTLIEDKKAYIDSTIDKFKQAVSDAYDKAQADCQAGVDKATIKANLKADLDAAREQFKADRQELKARYDIEKILEAIKAEIREAKLNFQEAVRAAGDELKASWNA